MEQTKLRLDLAISHQFRFSKVQDTFPDELKQLIIKYTKDTVTIIITHEREEAIETDIFFIQPYILSLSLKLHQMWNDKQNYLQPIELTTEETQIGIDTFKYVIQYLEHHDGKEPPALPCPVRSTDMYQIVTDKWDADFINDFNKQQMFEIIIAANKLDVKPLLHLGCAKVATLIKQLDQKEINRIIEEEEKYRKENQLEAPDTTQQIQLNLDENQGTEDTQDNPNTQNNENQEENDNLTEVDYTQEYRTQLESLANLGYTDQNKNLNALINNNGDLNAALEALNIK